MKKSIKKTPRLTLKRALELVYYEAFYAGVFEYPNMRRQDKEFARALEKVRATFNLEKLPEFPY